MRLRMGLRHNYKLQLGCFEFETSQKLLHNRNVRVTQSVESGILNEMARIQLSF